MIKTLNRIEIDSPISNIHVGIGISMKTKMRIIPSANTTSPRKTPANALRACDAPSLPFREEAKEPLLEGGGVSDIYLPHFRDIDAIVFILVEFVAKRADRNTENFCRVRTIAEAVIECIHNHVTLYFANGFTD